MSITMFGRWQPVVPPAHAVAEFSPRKTSIAAVDSRLKRSTDCARASGAAAASTSAAIAGRILDANGFDGDFAVVVGDAWQGGRQRADDLRMEFRPCAAPELLEGFVRSARPAVRARARDGVEGVGDVHD